MKKIICTLFAAFIMAGSAFAANPEMETLIRIHLFSDSTCAKTSGKSPQRGWGEMIQAYFNQSRVEVKNWAVSGTSSKTYINEGRWDKNKENIKEGDIVLIQFGINDGTQDKPQRYTMFNEYTKNLKKFISETRQLGGKPVLVTPVAKRNFVKGKFLPTANRTARALLMETLSLEMDVPMIDCHTETCNWIKKAGEEKSKGYFCHYGPNDYPSEKFRNGRKDDTHLNETGANYVAGIIAKNLIKFFPEIK